MTCCALCFQEGRGTLTKFIGCFMNKTKSFATKKYQSLDRASKKDLKSKGNASKSLKHINLKKR